MEKVGAAHLVLASGSPRRRAYLDMMGIAHVVLPSGEDEALLEGEPPEEFTLRTARQKAASVAARQPQGTWVLGADTAVVVDDQVLGKPNDLADARRMLHLLSGRGHRVLTAVALWRTGHGLFADFLTQTQVFFRLLSERWLEGYLATGEPMDKAGAYGIQGQGALLVTGITGSYTNVVGLPLAETADLLERAGLYQPFFRVGSPSPEPGGAG